MCSLTQKTGEFHTSDISRETVTGIGFVLTLLAVARTNPNPQAVAGGTSKLGAFDRGFVNIKTAIIEKSG